MPPNSREYEEGRIKMARIYLEQRNDKRRYAACFEEIAQRNQTPRSLIAYGDALMRIVEVRKAIEVCKLIMFALHFILETESYNSFFNDWSLVAHQMNLRYLCSRYMNKFFVRTRRIHILQRRSAKPTFEHIFMQKQSTIMKRL